MPEIIFPSRFTKIDSSIKKEETIKAFDSLANRVVWVKSSLASNTKIYNEYQVLHSIDSDKIVIAYEYIKEGEYHYIILENIEGNSLNKLLKKEITFTNKINIIKQLIQGFSAVEDANVLYRDFMDDHIIINKKYEVKLIDFNNVLKKKKTDSFYLNTHTQGFFATLSPEERYIGKEIYPNSNVYSICCVIYRILKGHYPIYELGNNINDLSKNKDFINLNKKIKSIKELTKQQNDILKAGLDYNPSNRPNSVCSLYESFFNERIVKRQNLNNNYWMINDNLAVSHRPGFSYSRIYCKNLYVEIEEGYKFLSQTFATAVCLLSTAEMERYYDVETFKKLGEKYFKEFIHFPLDSKPMLNNDFKALIKRIINLVNNKNKVVIHCNAGIGRACTLAACIISVIGDCELVKNYSVDEVIDLISKRRNESKVIENIEQRKLIDELFSDLKNI